MAGPTRYPFAKAFAFASLMLAVVLIALYAAYGAPKADKVGEIIGSLVMTLIVPAAITGYFARRSIAIWPLWKIAVVYLGCLAAVVFVLSFNRLKAL